MDTKLSTVIIVLLVATTVWGLRVPQPPRFEYPFTEEQVEELNDFIENMTNMQEGRVELDIVTTTKSNANNGEIWILNDSGTYKLEFKANDVVNTITP